MNLLLKPVSVPLRSIYKNKAGELVNLPARVAFGHPSLVNAVEKLERDKVRLVYSDFFRSAAASLARRREFAAKGGPQLAKRPGESPHNFGCAIDIDVNAALRELRLTKKQLDELLASYGLYCHLFDHSLAAESWHYNALGSHPEQWLKFASPKSTSRAVEAKIQALYGNEFSLTRDQIINALRDPRAGRVFLNVEPTTERVKAAVIGFQKFWDLDADGIPGRDTQRLLSYLTCNIVNPE